MPLTPDQVRAALATVNDPDLHKDLVTLGMVKDVRVDGDEHGHFGSYGGMFVPETLMSALRALTEEYTAAKADPAFQAELDGLLRDYCGRPTPLYFAERWTEKLGGPKIFLKREDLLHTGAHKINNALGQILLAKRLGKTRIIANRLAAASVRSPSGLKFRSAAACVMRWRPKDRSASPGRTSVASVRSERLGA